MDFISKAEWFIDFKFNMNEILSYFKCSAFSKKLI